MYSTQNRSILQGRLSSTMGIQAVFASCCRSFLLSNSMAYSIWRFRESRTTPSVWRSDSWQRSPESGGNFERTDGSRRMNVSYTHIAFAAAGFLMGFLVSYLASRRKSRREVRQKYIQLSALHAELESAEKRLLQLQTEQSTPARAAIQRNLPEGWNRFQLTSSRPIDPLRESDERTE